MLMVTIQSNYVIVIVSVYLLIVQLLFYSTKSQQNLYREYLAINFKFVCCSRDGAPRPKLIISLCFMLEICGLSAHLIRCAFLFLQCVGPLCSSPGTSVGLPTSSRVGITPTGRVYND